MNNPDPTRTTSFKVRCYENGAAKDDGKFHSVEAESRQLAAEKICGMPLTSVRRHDLYKRATVTTLNDLHDRIDFYEVPKE